MLTAVLRTLMSRAWRHKGEIVAVVVLVVIAGEVYLRLPIGRQLQYQPDAELGSIIAPSQQSLRETVNCDGHRGKDTDWSAPVILAVGDSQAWGEGVNDEAVWTARLEQQLIQHEELTDFQVVNAAHAGHGPFHHYKRLQRVLEQHRVDLLLVRVSIEDWSFRPIAARQAADEFAVAQRRQTLRQYTPLALYLGKRAGQQLASIRAVFRPRPGATSPTSTDKGQRMWEEQGVWWEKIADLAEEHGVPLVFWLYDPLDLPSSSVLQAHLQQCVAPRKHAYLFRLGSEVFGLRGQTPEAIEREFRARFRLPHDPHANALQHDHIGQAVHAYLTESGLLASVRSKRTNARRDTSPSGESASRQGRFAVRASP